MRYGLIGEHLSHSWSKIIHEQIADYTYDLIPLTKEEFKTFMTERNFTALNATIPYKQDVIPYLDEIEENARKINAVNTIVNRNGKLYGYNTDYTGFIYTLKNNKINVTGRKCIVLGNGGASKAIITALNNLGASQIIVVNRSQKDDYVISYEECYEKHFDAAIVVNTTPAGMYPLYLDQKSIDLTRLKGLQAVIDIVYNPLETLLLKEAKSLGIIAVNGLEMLVAQAKYASEHFLDCKISDSVIPKITDSLSKEMS